ncbi:hypothetical protein C8R44DRAFT_742583 [Mycena epipterygia]|nr:hypothetical protein C8R44DRAFT_742583 [Mycena epipterygia]
MSVRVNGVSVPFTAYPVEATTLVSAEFAAHFPPAAHFSSVQAFASLVPSTPGISFVILQDIYPHPTTHYASELKQVSIHLPTTSASGISAATKYNIEICPAPPLQSNNASSTSWPSHPPSLTTLVPVFPPVQFSIQSRKIVAVVFRIRVWNTKQPGFCIFEHSIICVGDIAP